MFRFFRGAQQEQDQEQQERQPLLQPDQIPYQSSYDSISENEVVNYLLQSINQSIRLKDFISFLLKHRRYAFCTPLSINRLSLCIFS